jgi:hypothetical protein
MPDPDFHFLGRELGTLIALLSTKEAEADALRNVLEGLRHGRGRSPTGEAIDHLLAELEKWNIELERAAFPRYESAKKVSVEVQTKADMTIIPKHAALPPRLRHG